MRFHARTSSILERSSSSSRGGETRSPCTTSEKRLRRKSGFSATSHDQFQQIPESFSSRSKRTQEPSAGFLEGDQKEPRCRGAFRIVERSYRPYKSSFDIRSWNKLRVPAACLLVNQIKIIFRSFMLHARNLVVPIHRKPSCGPCALQHIPETRCGSESHVLLLSGEKKSISMLLCSAEIYLKFKPLPL